MENIRPIKTEADYDWAISEISEYFENEPEVGSPEGDRFDVLATLVEAYENKHYPIDAPDPVDAIHAHMKLFDLSRTALVEVIGSSPRVTEVLSRKRALTIDMVHKLNRQWHIPAEVLVQPYHLERNPVLVAVKGRVKKHSAHTKTKGVAATPRAFSGPTPAEDPSHRSHHPEKQRS